VRVGIGAVLNPTGGPSRYALELVRALGEIDGEDRFIVFTNRPRDFVAGPTVAIVEVPLRAAMLEPLWDHVLLPAAARRHRLDVYHGVKGALPISIGCPRVVTVHDLAVYACPETFAWQQHLHMRPHLRLAAWQADRFIADSEHARGDLEARLGLPPGRVVTVPLGVRHDLFHPEAGPGDEETARRLDLPPRYFLYTGTIQPRKNLDVVVRAYSRLGEPPAWPLLLAGRRRPDYEPAWLRQPPPGVRYLGAPADEELAVLYRRAGAMVSPSSYEGFGLTFLEAMASGCPVIGAAVTSVPEVVGDAGILLPAPDVSQVAEAMHRLAADDALRAELGARGRRRAAAFTWAETARRTRAVYQEAARYG
jgi:glycosyltransferase involved in cell wall biosynthesis